MALGARRLRAGRRLCGDMRDAPRISDRGVGGRWRRCGRISRTRRRVGAETPAVRSLPRPAAAMGGRLARLLGDRGDLCPRPARRSTSVRPGPRPSSISATAGSSRRRGRNVDRSLPGHQMLRGERSARRRHALARLFRRACQFGSGMHATGRDRCMGVFADARQRISSARCPARRYRGAYGGGRSRGAAARHHRVRDQGNRAADRRAVTRAVRVEGLDRTLDVLPRPARRGRPAPAANGLDRRLRLGAGRSPAPCPMRPRSRSPSRRPALISAM